jgi:hypothetical protein
LKDKTAVKLKSTFNAFGRPEILQSDNGKEFVEQVSNN